MGWYFTLGLRFDAGPRGDTTFSPGETVTGVATVTVLGRRPRKFSALYLRVQSRATEPPQTDPETARVIDALAVNLLKQQQTHVLAPGRHDLPFQFRLPDPLRLRQGAAAPRGASVHYRVKLRAASQSLLPRDATLRVALWQTRPDGAPLFTPRYESGTAMQAASGPAGGGAPAPAGHSPRSTGDGRPPGSAKSSASRGARRHGFGDDPAHDYDFGCGSLADGSSLHCGGTSSGFSSDFGGGGGSSFFSGGGGGFDSGGCGGSSFSGGGSGGCSSGGGGDSGGGGGGGF